MDKVFIDRRSLPVLFFIKYYKAFLFVAATIAFIAALNVDMKPGGKLTIEGYKTLCIFFYCITLWMTNAIPLAITGLLAIVLIPTFGVLPGKVAYGFFGNEAVFFILGAFIIAVGNKKSGLSERVSLEILYRSGGSKRKLILYLLLFSAALACIMPEHAVAAILFPIISDIATMLKLQKGKDNFGKAIFLALAWGCVIGGVTTFLGGARNPIAIGLLQEFTEQNQTIGFYEWIKAVFPAVILMLFFAFILLLKFFKVGNEVMVSVNDIIKAKKIERGKFSLLEFKVAIITLITVAAWIIYNESGVANIAILSAVSMFLLNVISWEDAAESIDWGILIMYGGAISLGTALSKTNAVDFLADKIMSLFNPSPLMMIFIFMTFAIFLTEAISNSAVVMFLLPVGLKIAKMYGIDPKVITLCVAVPAGLAFMLPIGSPPNAICHAAGYYSIKESAFAGFIMNILAILALLIAVKFYWPLIGINFMAAK